MSFYNKTLKLQGIVESNANNEDKIDYIRLKRSVTMKFQNNYFGLPPYSVQQSPLALAYKSRAPYIDALLDESEDNLNRHSTIVSKSVDGTTMKRNHENNDELVSDENYTAQRKVANALLTMVSNEQLIKHFMFKGGLDAVLKLIFETKDVDVLCTTALCLIEASCTSANCLTLLNKNIFGSLQVFLDSSEEILKHYSAHILANLSTAPDLEDALISNNIVSSLQVINNQTHRVDTMCFILLTLSNVANAVSLPETTEIVMRMCTVITHKLDVMKSLPKAKFVADLYSNFSRLNSYSSRLVEEGVITLLLHMMDVHSNEVIMDKCIEVLANLSMNRKNRREISGSGIGSRLPTLFNKGSISTKSSALLVTGNLLSSGLFHDKVANHITITNILDNLYDLKYPSQFNAVSFCLCQLSKIESSCRILVECDVIPKLLKFFSKAPAESLDYMWTILSDISSYPAFFETLMSDGQDLIKLLYEEAKNITSRYHQHKCMVQIALNISYRSDLSAFLSIDILDILIQALKTIFTPSFTNANEFILINALTTLINITYSCKEARSITLSTDLIELFQTVGIENDKINVKYVGLLNIISNEESSCYKMLDLNAQKLIVALQDSFSKLISTCGPKRKKIQEFQKGHSIRNPATIENTTENTTSTNSTINNNILKTTLLRDPDYEYDASLEGELGKELSAATLHNLSLKRPNGAPGVLSTLLSLAKNCKTQRVLYCVRSLANMSAHNKAKVMLTKEARRIIPMLTVIMRCGCEEAERVQRYCAITLCNMLTAPLEKGLLMELAKSGAIVDLVVVTMLRINSSQTKETLGKVFFNLLNRAEIREILVVKLDLLSSILELTKIEHIGLLELCMYAVFNITCELNPTSGFEEQFSEKLKSLRLPRFLIYRLNYNPDLEGSVGTRYTRTLLGKSLSNMSFNKQLALEITNEQGTRISDALYRIYVLGSEEATFCACSIIYNISTIPECRVLTDSKAIKLLVEVVNSKTCTAVCTKYCIASLCNFSMMSVFFDVLNVPDVISSLVLILGSPQVHLSIKLEALQAIYNLVTQCTASRTVFVSCDGIISLWKFLKTQGGGLNKDDISSTGSVTISVTTDNSSSTVGPSIEQEESTLTTIAHVVKELCDELQKGDILYERKILNDGIMNIILKLSKFEISIVKLDMSFAIYSLSKGNDLLKLLKSDAIDIIFWLTLHDTLNMQDHIFRNVARALRCFSGTLDEAKSLLRQERFLTVFKTLIKSKNEDVLWQTAGCMYNLMCIEHCLKLLLDRGLVGFIFEIAASGYDSVKHICSACLHMIPDNMPNMDDPVVLELVLCLLEAQGDKFSQLTERPNDVLPYSNMISLCHNSSIFKPEGTEFKPLWTPQICEIDSVFTPVLLLTPANVQTDTHTSSSNDVYSAPSLLIHSKMNAKAYQYFKFEQHSAARGLSITVATPQLPVKVPPSHNATILSNNDKDDTNSTGNVSPSITTTSNSDYSYTTLGVASFANRKSFRVGSALETSRSNGIINSSSETTLLSNKKLPLIAQPLKVPDNTIDAINRTINNDSIRNQMKSPHAINQLSMSSSLMINNNSNNDKGRNNNSNSSSRNQNRVVQVSMNEHGNYSR